MEIIGKIISENIASSQSAVSDSQVIVKCDDGNQVSFKASRTYREKFQLLTKGKRVSVKLEKCGAELIAVSVKLAFPPGLLDTLIAQQDDDI